MTWRENFIRTYLERDVPQLGPRIPAQTLCRSWVMLAHTQGISGARHGVIHFVRDLDGDNRLAAALNGS